jgi:hypothetical protein
MVHEDGEGRPWSQTSTLVPVLQPGASVFGPEAVARPFGPLRHRLQWASGLRRASSATLLPPEPEPPIELQPLYAFRMKGVGYFHPEWSHGVWLGEQMVGGEQASTAELDVLRPDTVHLQQVVRARWGDRTGLGVLEQLVFGPYSPAGFTAALDGAP